MQSRFKTITNYALELFFPQKCIGCGREGELLCQVCYNNLPRIAPPVCPLCGIPGSGALCTECAEWKAYIDGIRSPFRFDGIIRQAVHRFKYNNLRALSLPLSVLLYEFLETHPVPFDVVVPVPLHPLKHRERGYNQAELLARNLGKLCGKPVVAGCLQRTRQTESQARTANLDERRRNVVGAFSCHGKELQSKQVLLIDDVSTSGTTLDECARAVKMGGAFSVWGLTLAKEV